MICESLFPEKLHFLRDIFTLFVHLSRKKCTSSRKMGFLEQPPDHLCNAPLRIDVLDRLVERLSELKGVLCELDTFRFYTSSLLITYDGGGNNGGWNNNGGGRPSHRLEGDEVGGEDEDDDEDDDIVDLRIIDFAHSTHEGMRDAVLHVGPDGGFVFGLNNFIEILGDIKGGRFAIGHCWDHYHYVLLRSSSLKDLRSF